MQRMSFFIAAVEALAATGFEAERNGRLEFGLQKAAVAIPPSLETEHHEIHEALLAATKVAGPVGAAATELAAVLGPHFERENEIALPPLGLLAALAAGEKPAGMEQALAMSNALRKEMPRMLREHAQIRVLTEKLRVVSQDAKNPVSARFAENLAAHAQMEEEVLYPAAILVGDVIQARLSQK